MIAPRSNDYSTEEDYDAAYMSGVSGAMLSNADLPLYTPVAKANRFVTIDHVLTRCRYYLGRDDIDLVMQAYQHAEKAHRGQVRKSGEPYITHPLSVASILAEWHLDATTVCAGILHDVLEDTEMTKSEMSALFGTAVTELVDGVSKLKKLHFSSNAEAQAESFRKMLLAMGRDVRVIFVKLADRLHNLRTLDVMRPEKRRRIAMETLEIYVPIAHRLGLNQVFRELQELSFYNSFPLRYKVLRENVLLMRNNRRAVLERIMQETRDALPKSGIQGRVIGRDKTIYGIYNRMKEKNASFSDALDIYGFRVIVKSLEDCYLTLCALHKLYKPVHYRFKDFIAVPKSNGYQGLHTTVIGPYGTPVEYQIRTEKMHQIAEYGILSNWLFSDTSGSETLELQQKVSAWLQSLIEIQRSSSDSAEFFENIKVDLFPDRVYTFTPKSRIIELPSGSTAIDFAYQVHSEVGNKASGCKINSEVMPLTTVLKNGDMIEIETHPKAHPDPTWLNYAHTGKARAVIRQYLRSRPESELIRFGQKLLDDAAKATGLDLNQIDSAVWDRVSQETGSTDRRHVLCDIGIGEQIAENVIIRLRRALQEALPATLLGGNGSRWHVSPCCCPLPGEAICGFLQKGKPLTIHRQSCEMAKRGKASDPAHWLDVQWSDQQDTQNRYEAPVDVTTSDAHQALSQAAPLLVQENSSIMGVSIEGKAPVQTIHLTAGVLDRDHLRRVISALKTIPCVTEAVRASGRKI